MSELMSEVLDNPWDTVAIDLKGLFPAGENILILIDCRITNQGSQSCQYQTPPQQIPSSKACLRSSPPLDTPNASPWTMDSNSDQ